MSKKKVIGIVAVVLVAVLTVGGLAFGGYLNTIAQKLKGDKNIATVKPAKGAPYYVLVLGGDSRTDEGETADNRTDSIMVARVDEKNQNVSIVSVPRDLRILVDGHGYCKINSAVEYGGYDTVVKEINELLGIQINYYAFVYFDEFEELVDRLGGVTVEVPEGTYYEGVSVPAGDAVTIDGEEALVLARCRHGYPPDTGAYAAGDYQRTLNQRNLMKAIANKVLDQDIASMPETIESLAGCIETNMELGSIVSMAQNLKGMDTDTIKTAQLPNAAAVINGEWFAVMYKDVFDVMDQNFIAGNELYEGLDGFSNDFVNDDLTPYYVDGPLYSYVLYQEHFGSMTATGGKAPTDSSTAGSSASK